MADDFANIRYHVAERVATITLNNPDRLNPITHGPGTMEDELIAALRLANADDEVRCIIVTGAGRAFSSGGGGGQHDPSASAWHAFLDEREQLFAQFIELGKPVIGAINGLCYGVAMRIAAHFDILLAADTATFGLIETRFGATGVEPLPYLVGRQWALFLAISGELITAHKAKEIGFVLEVFPPHELLGKAMDLGRRIAAMPAYAVRMNRRLVFASMNHMGYRTAMETAVALNAITNSVQDEAETADGRRFRDLRSDTKAFREARDAPFRVPWLPEDA